MTIWAPTLWQTLSILSVVLRNTPRQLSLLRLSKNMPSPCWTLYQIHGTDLSSSVNESSSSNKERKVRNLLVREEVPAVRKESAGRNVQSEISRLTWDGCWRCIQTVFDLPKSLSSVWWIPALLYCFENCCLLSRNRETHDQKAKTIQVISLEFLDCRRTGVDRRQGKGLNDCDIGDESLSKISVKLIHARKL